MLHLYYHKLDHRPQVLHELGDDIEFLDDHLILTRNQPLKYPAFAQDVWPDCEIITIKSINDGIQNLKKRKLRWFHYPLKSFRRAELINKELGKPEALPLNFPTNYSNRFNFGIFSLLNDNELLICKQPFKKVPLGQYEFVENKIIPPNRAYLKLWEALSILNKYPKAGETCIDLGASPGGWSWVLASFNAKVISVDKAELAPNISKMPQIKFLQESAFALDPNDFEKVDWLVCDVICYPERSLNLIEQWLATDKVKQIICTIKLQGKEDWDTIKKLQAIPNSQLLHLYQNKHELTWFYAKK